MLSGRRLDLLDPSPLDIEIVDIAHGLARVARWNGQTVGDYPLSVAQHSLLVEEILAVREPVSAQDRLAALLHDAPEYVVGDLISPFKSAIGAPYREVEARLTAAIHLRFSLPPENAAARRARIKAADAIAAHFEATALAGFTDAEADAIFGRPRLARQEFADHLSPWPTALAQERFLSRFATLDRARA